MKVKLRIRSPRRILFLGRGRHKAKGNRKPTPATLADANAASCAASNDETAAFGANLCAKQSVASSSLRAKNNGRSDGDAVLETGTSCATISHPKQAAPARTNDDICTDKTEEWTGVVTLLPGLSLESSTIHIRVGTSDRDSESRGSLVSAADDGISKHVTNAQFQPVLTERTATTAASTLCTALESSSSLASLGLDVSSSSALSTEASKTKNALLAPPNATIAPTDWGFPGFLTESEYATLVQFQSWIESEVETPSTAEDAYTERAIVDAIFSFGPQEDYFHALCRWLRARKYNLADTIAMVKEAVAERTVGDDAPVKHNFYPSAVEALGVEESIYKTQYPQVFPGATTRDGKVLFFSKPGRVNIHGLELVSTPDGVNRYQWNVMAHTFASVLRDTAARDPSFVRYQSCVVMDLEGLSRATCNSKVLAIIQHQSRVDALCFPEILGRCLIINAPSFFSLIWSIIRRWLDPRTASKIEIYSSKAKAEKRLQELIKEQHLPREYGGSAPTVEEMIVQQGSCDSYKNGRALKRRVTKLLHIRGHAKISVDVAAGEEMDVEVFTRSIGGAKFAVELESVASPKVQNEDDEADEVSAEHRRSCLDSIPHPHIPHPHISVPHLPHRRHHHANAYMLECAVQCPENQSEVEDPPFSDTIANGLKGPGTYHISGESLNKSTDYYLLICNIFEQLSSADMLYRL